MIEVLIIAMFFQKDCLVYEIHSDLRKDKIILTRYNGIAESTQVFQLRYHDQQKTAFIRPIEI